MINCPFCGQPVLEGQKFCGSCGKDIQSAPRPTPIVSSQPPSEEQAPPYAYSQPTGYGYEPYPSTQPPLGGRMIPIIGAVMLALCCAFACGLLFGFEIIPTILEFMGARGAPAPTPRPGATPASLLPIIHYIFSL